MRFALAAIDLVRPHVQLEVEGASLDLASNCVRLRWRVWGAMRADETYAVWRDGGSSKEDGSWRLASTSQSGAAVCNGRVVETGATTLQAGHKLRLVSQARLRWRHPAEDAREAALLPRLRAPREQPRMIQGASDASSEMRSVVRRRGASAVLPPEDRPAAAPSCGEEGQSESKGRVR